jgi:hypothetical protein
VCESLQIVHAAEPIVIDHACTDITRIPESAIEQAKANLRIAYGHTSHGSQLTAGMTGLIGFANDGGLGLSLSVDIFEWNNGGTGGALDLHDYFMSGDLGNPDRTTWAQRTRDYLDANSDVNVIMWSWCGQVDTTEENIDLYLSLMSQLELEYPDNDVLNCVEELNRKTNPNDADTDNDGLFDGEDLNPINPDSNADGVIDH